MSVHIVNKPRTLGVPEIAAALGIGRSTVYELINEGRLPTLKLGRRTLTRSAVAAR